MGRFSKLFQNHVTLTQDHAADCILDCGLASVYKIIATIFWAEAPRLYKEFLLFHGRKNMWLW